MEYHKKQLDRFLAHDRAMFTMQVFVNACREQTKKNEEHVIIVEYKEQPFEGFGIHCEWRRKKQTNEYKLSQGFSPDSVIVEFRTYSGADRYVSSICHKVIPLQDDTKILMKSLPTVRCRHFVKL